MNVGDAVQFTRQTNRDNVIDLRRLDGVIEAIDGEYATVKVGRIRHTVSLTKLKKPDEPSAVTEFLNTVQQNNLA